MAITVRIAAMEARLSFTISACTKSCPLIGSMDTCLPFIRAGEPAAVDARRSAPPGGAVFVLRMRRKGSGGPPTTRTIAPTTTPTILRLWHTDEMAGEQGRCYNADAASRNAAGEASLVGHSDAATQG